MGVGGTGEAEVLWSGKRAAWEDQAVNLPQAVHVPEAHRSEQAKKAKQSGTEEEGQGDKKRRQGFLIWDKRTQQVVCLA